MRVVNVRFLGLLLAISAGISAAAYALHGVQVRRNADKLLFAAKEAEQRNDLATAVDYLQRYVQLVPAGDLSPLVSLGLLQVKLDRPVDAFRTLDRAVSRDPTRDDLRRQLVETSLQLGRFNDASLHLKNLMQKFPGEVDLLSRYAECQQSLGEFASAEATYRQVLTAAPDTVETYGRLADLLYENLKNPLAAIRVLDELVAANPQSALAYAIRGSRWLQSGPQFQRALADRAVPDADETPAADSSANDPPSLPVRSDKDDPLDVAWQDAQSALQYDSTLEEVLSFAIRCFMARNDWDSARDQLKSALERYPENALLYGWMADAGTHDDQVPDAEKLPQAIQWLERGLAVLPRNTDLLWNLANRQIDDGQLVEAEKRIVQLEGLGNPRPFTEFLRAKLLVSNKDWFLAIQKFDAVRSALAAWPEIAVQADYWKGFCYGQLGWHDLQLAEFQRAIGTNPLYIPARLGAAAALTKLGELEQAINEYEALNPQQLPASAHLQLAEVSLLANLRRNPAERNWTLCLEKIAALEAAQQFRIEAAILRAEVLVAQENRAQAEQLLLAVRDQVPDSMKVWESLINLAVLQGEDDKAVELLRHAEQAVTDSVELRLAQARHLVYQFEKQNPIGSESPALADDEQPDEPASTADEKAAADKQVKAKSQRELAREELGKRLAVLATAPESLAEGKNELKFGIASLMFRVGDFSNAKELCLEIAEQEQYNWKVRLLLFDLAFSAGETAAMEQVLNQLNVIEQAGPLWHYGSAVRWAVEARRHNQPELYEKAKAHLREIKSRNWARVPALLGLISESQQDEDAALAEFTQAIELGERNPGILRRALELLVARQQYQEADQLIRKLQERQAGFSPELTERATEIYLNLHDTQRALSFINQVPLDSPHVNDHFWAGWKLVALGKHDQAEQHFRAAVKLDESSRTAWMQLISHLVWTVRLDEARQTLQQAESKIAPDEAPLLLGMGLELLKQPEEAEAQFQQALTLKPGDPLRKKTLVSFYLRQNQPQKAERLLEQMFQDADTTATDLAWCRLNLALVCLEKRPPNLELASRYVADNLAVNPASLPDRRMKGLILFEMPASAQTTSEAIKIFEEVLAETRAPSNVWGVREIHFRLAQLYARTKQDEQVRQHMIKIIPKTVDDYSAPYLRFYVGFLIDQGEFSDAETWLRSLVKLTPHDLAALQLGARLRYRMQRYGDVLKWLDQNLAKFNGSTVEKQTRIRETAFLLEAYARQLSAEPEDKASAEDRALSAKFLTRAEQLLNEMEQDRPEASIARAAFYGRRGQIDESLTLLEQDFASAKPEEIATVRATILSSPQPTAAQLARAEQLLRKLIEVHGRTILLLMALADHLNLTGQFAGAEQLYREVLSADPDNILALNNLSVLLALQGKGNDEPLQLIQRAISLNSHPALLDSRGTIYLARGDKVHAEEDLRQANSLRPTAGGYFRLALVAFRQGQLDSARQRFAEARKRNLNIGLLHPLERPLARQLEMSLK